MRTHTQSVVASVLSVPCVALCQVAESSDAPVSLEHATVVRLSVAAESERLMWSPKGATVELTTSADGTMRGQFKLGPKGSAPILVSLSKSRKSGHIDRLAIDFDRDGDLNDETVLTCEPKEQRGKIWSSFSAELPVPVSDPWGSDTSIPYRINLWYVFDPLEPDAPHNSAGVVVVSSLEHACSMGLRHLLWCASATWMA